MTKRNTEKRSVPGISKDFKVTRDGEVFVKGQERFNVTSVIADNGERWSIQLCIHKAFPDIPMRVIPTR